VGNNPFHIIKFKFVECFRLDYSKCPSNRIKCRDTQNIRPEPNPTVDEEIYMIGLPEQHYHPSAAASSSVHDIKTKMLSN